MSRSYLNLARRPYLNTRPIVRLSIVLWVVGALLFAGNVWLYWDFLAGRGDTHARLEEVAGEIDTTRARIASLESQLAGFDLADQNLRVEFLNSRIARRHFSWSRLFDALADLLPDDVRVARLTPSSEDDTPTTRASARRRPDEATSERVVLGIQGVARTNESILNLVDALFESPAFEQTRLNRQQSQQGGLIEFDLDTIYDPHAGEEKPPEEPAVAATSESVAPPPADSSAAVAPPPADPPLAKLGPPASSAPKVVR